MVNSLEIKFSDIEKDIIEQLKLGYTNERIAKKLNFSTYTIKYHIAKIIRKTNAVNRINAIYILARNGYFKNHEQEIELS